MWSRFRYRFRSRTRSRSRSRTRSRTRSRSRKSLEPVPPIDKFPEAGFVEPQLPSSSSALCPLCLCGELLCPRHRPTTVSITSNQPQDLLQRFEGGASVPRGIGNSDGNGEKVTGAYLLSARCFRASHCHDQSFCSETSFPGAGLWSPAGSAKHDKIARGEANDDGIELLRIRVAMLTKMV